MTTINLLLTDRKRPTAPTAPSTELPPLDFTWFDNYLEEYLTAPGSYTYDAGLGVVCANHAEQMTAYKDAYVGLTFSPPRDSIVYYDPTAIAMMAYYYKEARGHGQDQRWLNYAEDAGTFWWTANLRGEYTTATGVYHFPQGLYLCQDAGIVLTPSEFITACDKAIRIFHGNLYYGAGVTHERQSRESARLFEWLLYLFRMVGHNDPWYKNDDTHRGHRYHHGQFYQQNHLWEWLDEWSEAPLYPDNGPYTDPVDYAERAVDLANAAGGKAIFNFGPFMTQFTNQVNMQLYNEDFNYQTPERLDFVKRMVEFDRSYWFTPSGTPGANDQFGAYGYRYVACNSVGVGPIHAHCQSLSGTAIYWGFILGAVTEMTAWHLEALGWLWRVTGDIKYVTWFDETWAALAGMYNDNRMQGFMRNSAFGKQANQVALRIFHGIVLRGDLTFKTAAYPTGWPYPTPAQVDPNP